MKYFVDSHCHLGYPDFMQDRSRILERAQEKNIQFFLNVCTKKEEISLMLEIALQYPQVVTSVGVHPHEASIEGTLTAQQLGAYAQHPKVVALGETGLDYYYTIADPALQRTSLINHIQAAQECQLPLIIHAREAEADLLNIFDVHLPKTPAHIPGVIHCFTGTQEFAEACLDRGFYISIAGIVTFKKAEALQAIVKTLPLERLLIETDAPYLAPVPFRGKRNEPAFVVETARKIAELKGIALETLQMHTTENFFKVFPKAQEFAPHV